MSSNNFTFFLGLDQVSILIIGWLTGLGFCCLAVSQKEQALEKALKHLVALIKLLFPVLIFKVQKRGRAIPNWWVRKEKGCYLKTYTKTRVSQTPSDSSWRKCRELCRPTARPEERRKDIFSSKASSLSSLLNICPSEHLCMSPRHLDAFNTQGRSSLAPGTPTWCLML